MESIQGAYQEFGNQAQQTAQTISQGFQDFSNRAYVGASSSSEYLASNTYAAKFAFLFGVLIVFMICFHLGVGLVGYLFSAARSPYLVHGLQSGSNPLTVTQDPSQTASVVIYRSNNEDTGIEFTWSAWLLINANTTGSVEYKHIFNKGNGVYEQTGNTKGLATVNNGPGLYAFYDTGSKTQSLRFIMDVQKPSDAVTMDLPNIPIGKWFHVAYRLQNKVLDAYINGTIVQRKTIVGIPKQNFDNVYVCQNSGFPGSLSNLRYYDYALTATELQAIVYRGPNLYVSANNQSMSNYSYLSTMWYANEYKS